MVSYTLRIINKENEILCESVGEDYAGLVYDRSYCEGDRIEIEASKKDVYVVWQADDALGAAFCYLREGKTVYEVPFGERRIPYSPKAFYGEKHYLYVRTAEQEEIGAYRNLALNVYDRHGDTECFPHATANVETRGESVFAARNAIDGVCENRGHGEWPYASWGINMQDDAEMKVDFGREVETDKIRLYTRADFPHDNWWRQVKLEFSDGSVLVWDLEKSIRPHEICFEKKRIIWVRLYDLIKADDPSPFPALSQIEVYGRNP
ncbi:MAG: carbohydrate-binding protein [Lachnospiraceae bacterium]|nr:carbohydrate-binding protein [Lachnospiraceae bacterium]